MFFLLMLVEKDLVSNVKHLKINLIYVMWEGFLCERVFYVRGIFIEYVSYGIVVKIWLQCMTFLEIDCELPIWI